MRVIGYLILYALAAFMTSCATGEAGYVLPDEPVYTDEGMWHTVLNPASRADVLYITPTCIWDWTDENGNVCHFMNPADSSQRSNFIQPLLLASSLLGKDCSFYAPYYRQITMDSWMVSPQESERRFDIAFQDIVAAYRHFIDNISDGRPFILAGHSQGAKAVIELLKNVMTEEEYSRMVAAYIFGYPITEEDSDASPYLKAAADSSDTGCIISINSVSGISGASPLFASNTMCINPLNWKTDSTYAPASSNRGSVFFHSDGTSDTLYTVGARIAPQLNSIMIDGLDDDDYFIASIQSLFPEGNYHVYELNLYFKNIQDNIAYRIEQYL